MPPSSAASGRHPRVLILTALRVEHSAMREHLVDLREEEHEAGTRYEVGVLRGTACETALVLAGRGNVRAGVITERIANVFHPDVLLCVGVAGALHDDLQLADVVVATRVDAYHGGTASEDFQARPQTWAVPYRLEELARSVEPAWTERASADGNRLHFRPIAAGEVVLDSRESPLFAHLQLHHNDAAAIDMEDAGIAHAAHLNGLPTLVIRGISDRADGHKTEVDRAGWQQRAAENAASFAALLLAAQGSKTASAGQGGDASQAPASPSRRRPQAGYLEEKTAGFVGRESAFAQFRAFLDRHPSGHLIVEGEPGVGKSSLLAEEVRRNDWPAHFNIAASRISSVSALLHSLHEQLCDRYGLRFPPPTAGDDADGRYLGRLLEESADRLRPAEKLVIVIDALDEADHAGPDAHPLYLPTALQAGLYLLLSRRAHTAPLQLDGPSVVIDLMNRPDESRQDMEAFIRASLARPELAAQLPESVDREDLVSRLLERSELNFMYLVYVLRDLEEGRMRPDEVNQLPSGLSGYYERHLNRMLARDGGADLSLQTIYALAAIREPVPAELLAGVMGVTELQVVRLLSDWTQFLRRGKDNGATTYGFYHQGFSDFLARHDTVRAAHIDLGEISSLVAHRMIARLGLDLDE